MEYIPALRFNWLTPFYDIIVGTTTREGVFKKALIEQANIKPDSSVLDIGSGTGTLAIWAKKHQLLADITGIDGDQRIINIAKKKSEEKNIMVNFDRGLSYSLPYADATFDRVISSLFFHHLTWDNKVKTAREIFRVVKPGGEIHIADWGKPRNKLMRVLFLFIQLLDGFKTTKDNIDGKLVALFSEAGFSNVKERKTYNTIFGTMALYSGMKNS